LDFILTLQYTS